MVEQRPVGGAGQRGGGDLFEEEPAAGPQHAGDLAEGRPPVLDVVQDRELEHRVVAGVLCAQRPEQVGGTARGQPHPPGPVARQPSPCPLDHGRVEVERVHRGRAELVQDQLGARTRPAAQFQDPAAGDPAAQPGQQRRLVEALQAAAGRVVDHRCLGPVHQHDKNFMFLLPPSPVPRAVARATVLTILGERWFHALGKLRVRAMKISIRPLAEAGRQPAGLTASAVAVLWDAAVFRSPGAAIPAGWRRPRGSARVRTAMW
jgi:hypothetical protein